MFEPHFSPHEIFPTSRDFTGHLTVFPFSWNFFFRHDLFPNFLTFLTEKKTFKLFRTLAAWPWMSEICRRCHGFLSLWSPAEKIPQQCFCNVICITFPAYLLAEMSGASERTHRSRPLVCCIVILAVPYVPIFLAYLSAPIANNELTHRPSPVVAGRMGGALQTILMKQNGITWNTVRTSI